MAKNKKEIVKLNENEIKQNEISINPENLLSQAINKGLSLETIEKLLKMREDLKKEWAKEQFFIAFSDFQSVCPIINKDATVNFSSERTGKKTYYKYATLDTIVSQIKNHLKDYGFSYTIKTKQDKDSVTAICIAHHASGHSEETDFTIPIDKTAYMNDAQKVASALTYAKRYAFCNAFGIMTGDEDDDQKNTQDIDDQKNEQKKQSQNNSISDLPEQNKAIYHAIMKLVNTRHDKIDLLSGKEKADAVKNATAIKDKLEDLKNFHDVLEDLIMQRTAKIIEGENNGK